MKMMLGFTTAAAFFCFLAAYSSGVNAASGNQAAPDGKTVFSTICANCHGANGTGGRAPALKGQSEAELTRKLEGYTAGTYGGARKATMENMVKSRSPEELGAVVQYIGTL